MRLHRKLFLLLCCIPMLCQAQQKLFNSVEIKGGFLLDYDTFHEDQSTSYQNLIAKNNYQGLNFLSLGLAADRGKKVYGIELELSYFTNEIPIEINGPTEVPPLAMRKKFRSQANFYLGRNLVKSEKYKFYAAPIAGLSFLHEKNISNISAFYPVTSSAYILGLGLKFQNQFQLSEQLGIFLGTRFFLLDAQMQFDRIENPALPFRLQRQSGFNIDLIRKEVLVNIGLNLKI